MENERHPVIAGGVAELVNEALGCGFSTTISHECFRLVPPARHSICASACGSRRWDTQKGIYGELE